MSARVRLVRKIRIKLNEKYQWNSNYRKKEEIDDEECSALLKTTLCCKCTFDRWKIRRDYVQSCTCRFFSSRLDILLCIPLVVIIKEIRYRIRVTAKQRWRNQL